MTLNTPLHCHLIEQSDYLRMPWKNGLGETLEIQRHDDEQGLRFRISQASVNDHGVFSDFSGLHRTLVLLSGQGMTLSHRNANNESVEHALTAPLDMACFAGGDHTHASLTKGRIEDLNIMVRDSDTLATVHACFAPTALSLPNENSLLTGFYANEESLLAFQIDRTGDTETRRLPAQSFMTFSASNNELESLQVMSGSGVWIDILPR
ncbi:MAG: HutD family protein [Marinomonas sp.]|jgi:environmental stress-induced protein Ves